MKKKLFMLLALVMTAMTASAYDLTVGTSEHGTITFKIDGTTATSANENDVVTVEITPATGYVVNQPSGTWYAAVAGARSNAPIDLLKDVELTAAGTNTWTFTMKRANVEISATYKKLLTNTDITVQEIAALTYNGQAQEPTVTVKDGTTTLVLNTDYTVTYSNNTNAGTATVTITALATSENYAGETTKTFTINKANITPTAPTAKTGLVYTAQAQALVNAGSAEGGEMQYSLNGQSWSTTVPTGTNADTYTVYYKVVADANHNDVAAQNFNVTIDKATLTAATLQETNFTYNQQEQTALVATVTAGTLTVPAEGYDVSGNTATTVGNYTATITGKGNFTGSVTAQFSIIAADAQLFDVTLAPTEFVYNAQEQKPTVTVKDGSTVLTEGTDYDLTYTDAVNAGTVTVTATGKGNYTGTNTATYTIQKKALTVTADDKTVTYGDAAPEYTVSYDGFVNNETETVLGGTLDLACDYVQNQSGVGDYTITPSGLTSSNYDITFTAGTLTVSAKALEDAFIADIAAVTYNGQAQTPAPVLTFNGMTLVAGTDYTVAYQDNVNVGTATVTATAVAGGNYSGTASKTFVINPAGANLFDLTLDPTEYIYDGTAKTPAVTVKDGETVLVENTDYELAFTNNVNAGTATVTATGKGNYSGTASTTFAINKAALTVTADDKTVTYGDAAPEYTVSYDGFVNNETETVLGGTLALACDYVQNQSGVGTYAITPSGLTSSNYDITFTAGTLTVSAKALEDAFIADIAAVTYNGQAQTPAPVLTFNGMRLVARTDYTVAYSNNTNVGTATVTVSGTGNYSGTASKTFTINPAMLTAATLAETTFVYNQQEQTAEVASVKAGTLTVPATDYTVSGNKATTVGTYTATITGKGNFTGSVTAQFSIVAAAAEAQFTLIVSPEEFVYDGQEKQPVVTVKDGNATLVAGTDYTVSYQNNVNVGTATVTVTGQGNYEGTKTAQFTIVRDMSTVFSEGSSWATYVAQEDLELPEGIEAYTVTVATATKVSAEAISYIPAGVGILLNRSDVTKTDFKGYAYEGVTATIESLLVGSATEATDMTAYKDFVLYRDEFVLSGAASVAAGHAYLPAANVTAGVRALSIVIGGVTTGISEESIVKTEKFATATWYDLNGRKLQAAPTKKGMYIQNGKKVVIK